MDKEKKIITYFQLHEQEKRKLYLLNASSELLKDKQFAPGYAHILILQEDGTVNAFGNNEYGQCNVSGWTNVIKVTAGDFYSVALKNDGTVLATGDNRYGQCNVAGWKNIVDVFAEKGLTVGVKADGGLLFTGSEQPVSENPEKKPPRSDEVELTPVNEFFYTKDKVYNGYKINITGYLGNRTELRIPPIIEGCPVTAIHSRAFAESSMLSRIVLPETLTAIGYDAFRDCISLKKIDIPDDVYSISEKAFYGCEVLQEVTLSARLSTLGRKAFGSCPNLKCVRIPAEAKSRISAYALERAFDNLESINMIVV